MAELSRNVQYFVEGRATSCINHTTMHTIKLLWYPGIASGFDWFVTCGINLINRQTSTTLLLNTGECSYLAAFETKVNSNIIESLKTPSQMHVTLT